MTEKEQHSTSQTEETHLFHDQVEDEITFEDILAVLIRKKALILAVSSICTLIAIFFAQSITPTYRATIGFLEPMETYLSVLPPEVSRQIPGGVKPKKEEAPNVTAYSLFLSQLESYQLKKEVFKKGDFLKKFYGDSNAVNVDNAVLKIHSSISITKEVVAEGLPDYGRPVFLEMKGSNPEVMSEFLNALAELAKEDIVKRIRDLVRFLINAKITKISFEINNRSLVEKKKREEKRANEMLFFSEALVIAKDLGIKNYNFNKLQQSNFNLGITTRGLISGITKTTTMVDSTSYTEFEDQVGVEFQDTTLPFWYLYGEKALQLELDKLTSRKLKIPALGNNLKNLTLISYQGIDVASLEIKVANLSQPSIPPTSPIAPNKQKITAIGMALGIIFGVILAFLSHSMDRLREKKILSTSTAKKVSSAT